MTTPLEFSQVYTILNKIKEGDDSHQAELKLILSDFKEGAKAESFLHQLGQMFLYIGVQELYKFTSSENLKFIGQLTKEEWDELVKKNNSDLHIYLANSMINFLKDNQQSEEVASKWNVSKGEVEKHIMPMARYITEGIIDVLE